MDMTKLQAIISQIQELPADEQRAVIFEFTHLLAPAEDDIFELTDAELAELDRRMKDDTVMFTQEEVMKTLREKYATDTSTQ